jgi:hypothetical protein
MIDYYVALLAPERSGGLAWSALPHAPVVRDAPPTRTAGPLRRAAARRLLALAGRLDRQATPAG